MKSISQSQKTLCNQSISRKRSIYERVQEIDMDNCTRVFKQYDDQNKDWIPAHLLRDALYHVGIEFSHSNIFHKLLSSLKNKTGRISFFEFTKIVAKRMKETGEDEHEDIMDAYVAMGGDEDGGGNIDADALIDIIENQFGMTIDIRRLIDEIDEDGSGEIEFEEFEKLLETEGENPEIHNFSEWFSM